MLNDGAPKKLPAWKRMKAGVMRAVARRLRRWRGNFYRFTVVVAEYLKRKALLL